MTCSHCFQQLRLRWLGCLGVVLLGLHALPTSATPLRTDNAMGEGIPAAIAAEHYSVDERLLAAIRAYDVEAAKAALDQGADPNAGNSYEGYALTIAASLGDPEMVQLLVEHGADINIVLDEGYTPLAEAVDRGHSQVVAYLLDIGVNPNQTASGVSLLLTAAQSGRPDLVELLLQYGADPNYQSTSSILDETRRSQHSSQAAYDQVIRLLIEAGAQ